MKKLFILFTLLLSTTVVLGQNEISNVTNYVTDNGNFLTTREESELNSWISNYEKSTSIQIGIVTISDLEGEDISDYSVRTFNNLGIGKRGANNGLLFVFSMNDRKSWITTGSGIEQFLTDEMCVNILSEDAKPNFKTGNYFQGMLSSLNHIKNILGEENIEDTKLKLINIAKQKEIWQKERQAKIDRENDIMWQNVKDVTINILAILIILGVITYFIRLQMIRAKELKLIAENSDKILGLNSNITKPTLSSSRLNDSYTNIVDMLESKDWDKIRKDAKDNKSFISIQENFIETFNELINRHQNIYSNLLSKLNEINTIDEYASDCKRTIESGIRYNTRIANEFGQDYIFKNFVDESGKIDSLLKSFNKSDNDIDDTYSKLNSIKNQMNLLTKSTKDVQDLYNSLSNKKSFIDSETNIKSLVSRGKQLSKYDKNNELSTIQPEIDKYESSKSKYTELNSAYSHKMVLYSFIERIVNKLEDLYNEEQREIRRKAEAEARAKREKEEAEARERRRKREEEEEEERRRRNSYSSSYSSGSSWNNNSSSDSGSSWSGFDGGSSSGGGGGGDW